MWKTSILLLCLTAASTLADTPNYFKVLIREIDNPAGTLQDGTPCSSFAYLGVGCNSYLRAAVSAGGLDVSGTNYLDSSSPINTHGETRVSNLNVEVSDGYVTELTSFSGFSLHIALASDSDFVNVIDNYTIQVNAADQTGVYTYTSLRPGTLSTTISIAWSTNIPVASGSTTPGPTTSGTPFTGSTPSQGPTEAPTTTPKLPVDCDEVADKTSGNQIIYPNGADPVVVYCDQSSNGAYTVIQSRGTATNISFDLAFNNYTDWFGAPGKGSNYWFGLENMNKLSTNGKKYSLQIDLCCGTKLIKKYFYHSFSVGDSASQYKLSATADLPGVGLAFKSTVTDIGVAFSVPTGDKHYVKPSGKAECDQFDYYDDDDNQSVGYGGWWYGSCGNNLNGFLYPNVNGKCQLSDSTFASTKLLGVNMRTAAGSGYNGYDVDFQSYDRVRMALFTFDSAVIDQQDSSFCS